MMYVEKRRACRLWKYYFFRKQLRNVYTRNRTCLHLHYSRKLIDVLMMDLASDLAMQFENMISNGIGINLINYLNEDKNFRLHEKTATADIAYDIGTLIPYLTSALILTLSDLWQRQINELLKSETELWTTLKKVGLTK